MTTDHRLAYLTDHLAATEEGKRNAMLFWATLTALEEGHDPEDIAKEMYRAAMASGLEHRETLATIRSAMHRHVANQPILPFEEVFTNEVAAEIIWVSNRIAEGVSLDDAEAEWEAAHPLPPIDSNEPDEQEDDEDIATGDLAEFSVPLPTDIDPAAFHGPLGEYFQNASGYSTEASAVAMFAISLSAISALIGRRRWLPLGHIRVHVRVWVLLVGITARARKGTAWQVSRAVLGGHTAVDNVHGYSEVTSNLKGINSGEGAEVALIDAANGRDTVNAHLFVDEFASVMRRAQRDGDTLSTFIRRAYDGVAIVRQTANQKSNGNVRFPHVTVAAATTPGELLQMTDQTDKDSGLLNRFMTLGIAGTFIDHIPADDEAYAEQAADYVNKALYALDDEAQDENVNIRTGQPMTMSPRVEDAYNHWRALNDAAADSGAVGGMENRAVNHVLSIAMTLAVLDQTTVIEESHFIAALAFWDLHERTIRAIWAPAPPTGDHRRVWNYLRKKDAEAIAKGEPPGVAPSRVKQVLFHGRSSRGDSTITDLFVSGWIESFKTSTNAKSPRLRARDLRNSGGNAAKVIAMLRNPPTP